MHFEKVVIGIVPLIVGSLIVFPTLMGTVNTCIFHDYGPIGPPYGSGSPFDCSYAFRQVYGILAIFIPVMGVGIWFIICGLTDRSIIPKRRDTQKDVIIGLTIAGAVVGVAFLVPYIGYQLEQSAKIPRIDYGFQNPEANYSNLRLICFDDPIEPGNQAFTVNKTREIPVYLRNRGELDGGAIITMNTIGAKVANSKNGEFSYSVFLAVPIPNDSNWKHVLFYVKPEPNQETMKIWLNAVGLDKAALFPQGTTSVDLQKKGITFECNLVGHGSTAFAINLS